MPDKSARQFSEEQDAVLRNTSRITVVSAGPGSGKTRVFVEKLNRLLAERTVNSLGGIAALSFTQVAQKEITSRIGYTLASPHFVGTLDSFLLRTIVRPFGHVIGLKDSGLKLIPAPFHEQIDFPQSLVNGINKSIFQIDLIGGTEVQPDLQTSDRITRQTVKLNGSESAEALSRKEAEWRGRGWITHSDCHYIAAKILNHPRYGEQILAIISRRYPTILVDEVQDTGWFQARAILRLLGEHSINGLVVGDPNQAIYQFNGAHPNIFESFLELKGARMLPISTSQRCPIKVCAVATTLSESKTVLRPKAAALPGRAILITHSMDSPVLDARLRDKILQFYKSGETIALLTRKSSTLKHLTNQVEQSVPKGFSKFGEKIFNAATQFASGENSKAVANIEAVLGAFLFDARTVTSKMLLEMGVTPNQWRHSIFEILKAARLQVDEESWNAWLTRMKEVVNQVLTTLNWTGTATDLSPKFKRSRLGDGSKLLLTIPEPLIGWPRALTISTVHQVKGEEYDCVALFCPKPHARHSPCPSTDWFSLTANEERRIAFVASSRAKSTFILCVHETTYRNLRDNRPTFFSLFESPTKLL